MILSILSYCQVFSKNNRLIKTIIAGFIIYAVIYFAVYTKYASKISFIKNFRQYILYVPIFDLFVMFVINKNKITQNIKKKKILNSYECITEDDENVEKHNVFSKDDDSSDIELPVYKQIN